MKFCLLHKFGFRDCLRCSLGRKRPLVIAEEGLCRGRESHLGAPVGPQTPSSVPGVRISGPGDARKLLRDSDGQWGLRAA